ncbi:Protein of unknown function [Bacillus mycoides]|nr:Protein of unknown function [Bacillus mycoides]
MDLVVKSA